MTSPPEVTNTTKTAAYVAVDIKVSALVRATKLSTTNPNARTETDTVIRLLTRLWEKLIKTMGTRINAPPAKVVMAAAKALTENAGAIGGRPFV